MFYDPISNLYRIHFTGFEGLTHYIRLDHFETLVRTNSIYLTRQDLQEKDPDDGAYPAANKTKLHPRDITLLGSLGRSEAEARALADNHQSGNSYMRERHYLHCWTLRDDESLAMWKLHGFSGKGVCIKTNVRRLCEAIGGDRFTGHNGGDFDLKLQPVVCTDDPIPTVPSYEVAFRKRDIPSHVNEAEVRLLACDYEIANPIGPERQRVPVSLERLFQAVYLGSGIPTDECTRIEALTNTAAGSRVVRQSTVHCP